MRHVVTIANHHLKTSYEAPKIRIYRPKKQEDSLFESLLAFNDPHALIYAHLPSEAEEE
jgi:hypothetical protein